jgi:hypothetical protein
MNTSQLVSEVGLINQIIGLKVEFVVSAPANKNGKHGSPESHAGNDGRNGGPDGTHFEIRPRKKWTPA